MTAMDLQDRRRKACQEVRERTISMMVSDPERYGSLRLEDIHEVATSVSNYVWDVVVELTQ